MIQVIDLLMILLINEIIRVADDHLMPSAIVAIWLEGTVGILLLSMFDHALVKLFLVM